MLSRDDGVSTGRCGAIDVIPPKAQAGLLTSLGSACPADFPQKAGQFGRSFAFGRNCGCESADYDFVSVFPDNETGHLRK